MKIFVGSLPFSIQEDELSKYFEKYGSVSSATIIMDKFTGRSRGFAFVEMENDEEAKKAIQDLNGKEVSGRTIVVNQAEERKDNNRGGGGNYGNRNNQGGGGYNSGGYNRGGGRDNRDSYNKGGGKDRY